MEKEQKEIKPHPLLLDTLFSYRKKTISVFKDILMKNHLDHIAITHINEEDQLIVLSSTPAIEFNLFNSNLWRYDKTYHADWLAQYTASRWQSLYAPDRYDELYYLKQQKHRYQIGLSMAAKFNEKRFVFSIASKQATNQTKAFFCNPASKLYNIGIHCTKLLFAELIASAQA